jgi:hypothetical protein
MNGRGDIQAGDRTTQTAPVRGTRVPRPAHAQTHDPSVKRCAAVTTARDILNGTVCECGHVSGDHATDSTAPAGYRECGECRCRVFRPVQFTVYRTVQRSRR